MTKRFLASILICCLFTGCPQPQNSTTYVPIIKVKDKERVLIFEQKCDDYYSVDVEGNEVIIFNDNGDRVFIAKLDEGHTVNIVRSIKDK
jgi:hypothetical protein